MFFVNFNVGVHRRVSRHLGHHGRSQGLEAKHPVVSLSPHRCAEVTSASANSNIQKFFGRFEHASPFKIELVDLKT